MLFLLLGGWSLLSILVALFVGKFIELAQSEPPRLSRRDSVSARHCRPVYH
jgi:hypothetical protein